MTNDLDQSFGHFTFIEESEDQRICVSSFPNVKLQPDFKSRDAKYRVSIAALQLLTFEHTYVIETTKAATSLTNESMFSRLKKNLSECTVTPVVVCKYCDQHLM